MYWYINKTDETIHDSRPNLTLNNQNNETVSLIDIAVPKTPQSFIYP